MASSTNNFLYNSTADLEDTISSLSYRMDKLEKKIDLLILAVERIENLLVTFRPILRLINMFPLMK